MGDLRLMHSPRQSTLHKSPCKETSQRVCQSPQDPAASSCTDSNPNPQSRAGVPAAVSQQGHRATQTITVGWVSPQGQGSTKLGISSTTQVGRSGKFFVHSLGRARDQQQELLGKEHRHRPSHRALLLPCSNLKPKPEPQNHPNTGSS